MKNELLRQCEQTLNKCISDALTSYNSPLNKAVIESLEIVSPELKAMANEAVTDLVNDAEFEIILKTELKRKLSKVLISQFGGEIEKSVNQLKQDPTSRAKITLAIDSVMNDLLKRK